MSTIVTSLPQGMKIGLAFSGGLDTSAVICWLRQNGAVPYAYIADLGQCNRAQLASMARQALYFGAEKVSILDCTYSLVEGGLEIVTCHALNVVTAGLPYFNTTPISRAIIGTMLSLLMKKDGIQFWSDGSTYKGNDIERFYNYCKLVHPQLFIYKPWLDHNFVNKLGSRHDLHRFLQQNGFKLGIHSPHHYSVDSNMLGSTYEGKSLERLDYGVQDVINNNTTTIEQVAVYFAAGQPQALNGKLLPLYELVNQLNNIGLMHGIGWCDQVEDRIVQAKSRGVYVAPGLFILHVMFERLLSSVLDGTSLVMRKILGTLLGQALYNGCWFATYALALKTSISSLITPRVTGQVCLELRFGNDYTILDTYAPAMAYNINELSMDNKTAKFTPQDRIGQLSMLDTSLAYNRSCLKHTRFSAYGIPTTTN